MTSDRYLKAVLSLIAACLVYISLALTAWPAASAQGNTPCVIVGWQASVSGATRNFALPAPAHVISNVAPLPVSTK